MKHRVTVVFEFDVTNDLALTVTTLKQSLMQVYMHPDPVRTIVRAEVIPSDAAAPMVAPTVFP